MKLKVFYLVAFMFFPCMAIADSAVSTMASVLSELNHFPSATDKEALAGIVDDASSTSDEKTLALISSRMATQARHEEKADREKPPHSNP